MSPPGRYCAPTSHPLPSSPDAPSHRLHQLESIMRQACMNAIHPLEVTAHLEALGYNRYRVQREFKLKDTFELARVLFARVPRRQYRTVIPMPAHVTPPGPTHAIAWAACLLMLLLSTAQIGVPSIPMAVWLLAWSQGAGALAWTAKRELGSEQVPCVFTINLLVGLLGVVILGSAHGLSFLSVGVLWLLVVLHQWQHLPRRACLVVLPALLVQTFGPPALHAATVAALALWAARPFVRIPTGADVRWFLRHAPRAATHLLYGLALGVMLTQLLPASTIGSAWAVAAAVFGGLWCGAIFGIARRNLHHLLWRTEPGAAYAREAKRITLLALIAVSAQLSGPLLLSVMGQHDWAASLAPLVVLNVLAAGVSWCAELNRPQYAMLAVVTAAAAVMLGAPFQVVAVMALMIVAAQALRVSAEPHVFGHTLL